MKHKQIAALVAALAIILLTVLPAFAAETVEETKPAGEATTAEATRVIDPTQPQLLLTSADCAVGETVTVRMSMKNVAQLTSCDLHLQYNPHMVRVKSLDACDDIKADHQIYYEMTQPSVDESGRDKDGKLLYTINISLFHAERFPQSLNECDVFDFTFTAIGGGECPLVLAASSFCINDDEVYPAIVSGKLRIEGEQAQSWDYEKNVDPDVIYTDAVYPYAPPNTTRSSVKTSAANLGLKGEKGNAAKIAIVIGAVAVVAVIVVVAVVIDKKKYLKD